MQTELTKLIKVIFKDLVFGIRFVLARRIEKYIKNRMVKAQLNEELKKFSDVENIS